MRAQLAIAIAATIFSLPAVAEDGQVGGFLFAGPEVDTSFEASRSRLVAQGYHEVEMIDGSPYHLVVLDQVGSEVLLSIDPQTGESVRVASPSSQ